LIRVIRERDKIREVLGGIWKRKAALKTVIM
jgi:hypothetical protein